MPPAELSLMLEDQPTSFKHMNHQEVLEDLSSRFILNLPESELQSIERICFQVEQAHWYYEDFVREENRALPSLPLKKFSAMLFRSCPILKQWSHDHEVAFDNFMQYKTRVPVCGAIMLNESLDKCILVKGWKSSSGWGFPKGKINENEAHSTCAAREVLEETGYDLTDKIVESDQIQLTIREQVVTLFIVTGVPEDAVFVTRTRKEISKIEWFKLTDLPTWKRNRTSTSKFYLISPFIGPLKEFLHLRKQAAKAKRKQRQQLANDHDIEQPAGESASVIDNLFARIASTPAPPDDSDTASSSNNSSPTASTVTRRTPADPHFDRLINSLVSSSLSDVAGSSATSSERASTPTSSAPGASPSQTPQAPNGRLHLSSGPSPARTPSLTSQSTSTSASSSPGQDAQEFNRKRRQLALLEAVSEEIAQAQAQATPQPPQPAILPQPHPHARPATTSPVRPLHPHAFMQAPPPYSLHQPQIHPLPAHQVQLPFQVQPQFQQMGPVLANGPTRSVLNGLNGPPPPPVLNGAGPVMPNGMPALNGLQGGPHLNGLQGGSLPQLNGVQLGPQLNGAQLGPQLNGAQLGHQLNGAQPGPQLNGAQLGPQLLGGAYRQPIRGAFPSMSGGVPPFGLNGINGGPLPPLPANFGGSLPNTQSGSLPPFPANVNVNIPPAMNGMNPFPLSPVSANSANGFQPIVHGFPGASLNPSGRPQLPPLQPLSLNRTQALSQGQYGNVPLSAGPTFATHQQPMQQTQQQQHLLALLTQRPPAGPSMQQQQQQPQLQQPARPSTAAANPHAQALLDILNGPGPRL